MQKINISLSNIKPTKALILSFILISLLLSGCSNKRSQNKEKELATPNENGLPIFDGKSLDGWKITKFGTEGPVQVTDGKIILGMGDGLTGITWKDNFPRMNYEINLEAMKMSGNDFFCGITFPVDTTFCSFIVGGWGGPVVGLSTIDGSDASENSTKKLMRFEKNVWYSIQLKVTPGLIEAWVDNEKMVDFKTQGHEIYIRPEVQLSTPFGIASWITTSALRDIRLKEIPQSDTQPDN